MDMWQSQILAHVHPFQGHIMDISSRGSGAGHGRKGGGAYCLAQRSGCEHYHDSQPVARQRATGCQLESNMKEQIFLDISFPLMVSNLDLMYGVLQGLYFLDNLNPLLRAPEPLLLMNIQSLSHAE